jgi:replicative DNA helicase
MLTKVLASICGVLILVLCLCGFLYSSQRHSLIEARGQATFYKEKAQELSQSLVDLKASKKVDEQVTVQVESSKESLDTKINKTKETVDAVTKKVEKGEITDAAADAAYLNSMWEAYCEISDDPSCSSRKLNNRN